MLTSLSTREVARVTVPPKADDDSVDVARIFGLLRTRWRTVAVVTVLVTAVVLVATLVSPLTFSSSGRLYLGELTSVFPPMGDEMDISATAQGDISSEVEILMSRSLVARAVSESGLNVRIRHHAHEPPKYWEWRLSKRDPALIDSALRKLRATQTGFSSRTRDARSLRVAFTSPTTYEVREPVTEQVLGTGALGETSTIENLTLKLTAGAEQGPSTGEVYDMTVQPIPAAVDSALGVLTVSATKAVAGAQPNVINLTYADESPLMAAEFLSSLMRAYLQERQEWKTENASAAEAFVSEQLHSMRQSLDKAQADLAKYRAENRVVVLDSEAEAMITQISRYEEQRVAARLETQALSGVKAALASGNPAPEAFMLGEAKDTVLAEMAQALAVSRRELSELETRFSPEAPDVVSKRAQVDAQLGTIRSYVSNRLKRAQDSLGTLSGIIGKYEEKLKTVPGAELGLAQLTREAEVYDSLYAFLLRRQQQAAITKASTVSKNRVLDQPEVAFWEASPKLGLRLTSIPLGGVVGVLVVLIGSMFSRHFQTGSDVQASLGAIPVFATIPRAFARSRRGKTDPTNSGGMMSPQVTFGFVEAFRTLRTNLYIAAPSSAGDGKVILVTSPTPGDGKTTCALSLAWILAADGKRVMVIDADLRKPSHFALTEGGEPQERSCDLLDVLNGDCEWQDVAKLLKGSNQEIYSLSVDRPASAEVLSGQHIRPFLNKLRRDLDYIVVDVASFPLVSDALIVAPAADATISVVRPGNTPRRLAVDHVRQLSASSNVYGLLVNDSAVDDAYGMAYPRVA